MGPRRIALPPLREDPDSPPDHRSGGRSAAGDRQFTRRPSIMTSLSIAIPIADKWLRAQLMLPAIDLLGFAVDLCPERTKQGGRLAKIIKLLLAPRNRPQIVATESKSNNSLTCRVPFRLALIGSLCLVAQLICAPKRPAFTLETDTRLPTLRTVRQVLELSRVEAVKGLFTWAT